MLCSSSHKITSFNTQPPEGGCQVYTICLVLRVRFNTQPPEGGCRSILRFSDEREGFNTQPPEGGCYWYLFG